LIAACGTGVGLALRAAWCASHGMHAYVGGRTFAPSRGWRGRRPGSSSPSRTRRSARIRTGG
jgi:hypothetical protein